MAKRRATVTVDYFLDPKPDDPIDVRISGRPLRRVAEDPGYMEFALRGQFLLIGPVVKPKSARKRRKNG